MLPRMSALRSDQGGEPEPAGQPGRLSAEPLGIDELFALAEQAAGPAPEPSAPVAEARPTPPPIPPPRPSSGPRPAARRHVPVRDLEVGELRAFCAAATLGSIAEAARAMGVSQPAMSKRMRALEHVAGANLFERSSRGVTLTPAGVQLYSAARRLLRSADSVQALISSPPSAPVRIAASPTVAELRLPHVLGQLADSEPGLATELISANSELVRELVRDGRSDLGIASVDPYALYSDGLKQWIVWRDELVVAVPSGHPWEQYEEIPAQEFAQTEILQRDPWSNSSRVVNATLERQGLERTAPDAVVGSSATILALAQTRGRPALISMMAARANPQQQPEVRRVEGLRFGLDYALVWVGTMLDLRPEVQTVAGHILHTPFARPRSGAPAGVESEVPTGQTPPLAAAGALAGPLAGLPDADLPLTPGVPQGVWGHPGAGPTR